MTDHSSPVDGSTRGGRIQLQRWRTGPTPCPSQRRADRLTPPRPALQPQRTRATYVELLRLEILGLDQLLISTRGPLGHRRVRWEPRAGVSVHRCPGQPLAGHRNTGGIPISDPTAGLLITQPLRHHPQRGELSRRDPQIGSRNPRNIRSRHVHIARVARPDDISKRTTNHHRQVKRQNPAATAEICAQGRAGQAPQRTPPAAGTVAGPELRLGRPSPQRAIGKTSCAPLPGPLRSHKIFSRCPSVASLHDHCTALLRRRGARRPPHGASNRTPIPPPAKETNR